MSAMVILGEGQVCGGDKCRNILRRPLGQWSAERTCGCWHACVSVCATTPVIARRAVLALITALTLPLPFTGAYGI